MTVWAVLLIPVVGAVLALLVLGAVLWRVAGGGPEAR